MKQLKTKTSHRAIPEAYPTVVKFIRCECGVYHPIGHYTDAQLRGVAGEWMAALLQHAAEQRKNPR